MGWCSGTEIFDAVVKHVVNKRNDVPKKEKLELLVDLIRALSDNDWDCECDSDYIDDELVRSAFIRYDSKWKQYFKEMDEDKL